MYLIVFEDDDCFESSFDTFEDVLTDFVEHFDSKKHSAEDIQRQIFGWLDSYRIIKIEEEVSTECMAKSLSLGKIQEILDNLHNVSPKQKLERLLNEKRTLTKEIHQLRKTMEH